MRKFAIVLALVLAAGLPALLWAQQSGGPQGAQDQDRYGGRDWDMWDMMGGGGYGGGYGMMGGFGMMGGGMMGGGLAGFAPDLFDRAQQLLGLTDDQVTRLRGLWLDFVRATATTRANIQVAQANLQNLMNAKPVNQTQVEQQVRSIAQMRGDLEVAGVRFALQAKALLTPDQLQKLRSFWGGGFRRAYDGYRGGADGGQGPGYRGGMMGPGGMMGNP